MSFSTRILPPSEWVRLDDTEAGVDEHAEMDWARLDPARNTIVVVERDDGTIVGSVVLMQTLHAECVWIDPAHRKRGVVARYLRDRLFREAVGWPLLASAMSAEMHGILCGLGGQRLLADHYVLSTMKES